MSTPEQDRDASLAAAKEAYRRTEASIAATVESVLQRLGSSKPTRMDHKFWYAFYSNRLVVMKWPALPFPWVKASLRHRVLDLQVGPYVILATFTRRPTPARG